MNHPNNENPKPLNDTQPSAEDDQPLKQFFDKAASEEVGHVEEDPFFSPLPEIDISEEEEPNENTSSEEASCEDTSSEDTSSEDPSDVTPSDEASDDACTETTYLSEQTLSGSDDAAAEDDAVGEKPRRKCARTVGIAAGAVGGVVVLVFAVLCAILFRLSGPVTVDLDQTVSLGALQTHPILSALTEIDPQPSDIDTSSQGERTLSLTFFGFVPRTVTVSVCDLTPPAVTVWRMTAAVGIALNASDCVLSCDDKTSVTHTFAAAPDTSSAGEFTVLLRSEDEGGNITETPVALTVSSDDASVQAEFGVTGEEIAALFADAYPAYPSFDLTAIDEGSCGTYRVTAETDTDRAVFALVLSDTTAPTGKARSYDLLAGTALSPEDFVTNIKDASEVTLSYVTAPDYNSFAPQTVSVLAVDAQGNETAFTSALQIWNIADTLTAECGITLDALRKELFVGVSGTDTPGFDASFDPASLAPGTYQVRLRGEYSAPTVSLTMVDTKPPALTLKAVTAYVGHALTPEQVTESVTDATDVTLAFVGTPDTTKAGTLTVTVTATDAAGNKTEAKTNVTVIADTAAPQIYGVKTIYAQQNGTVSYRSGVSAYDNADGNVTVKVDASRVDVTKVGKYYVVYTATDKAGNTATQSALVYVTGANQASVNLYADEILASIIKPGMTDTQKARAIYDWCVAHLRYSTSTSHLMGHFIEAAYSGFTKHIGNCYTYYAVASALLTRAGIENIEIQRNNPYAPHYWNLVKIGGAWYHLDTCPKWKSYPIKTFLLTDAQVKHYSETQNIGYYSFDASRYPATP